MQATYVLTARSRLKYCRVDTVVIKKILEEISLHYSHARAIAGDSYWIDFFSVTPDFRIQPLGKIKTHR